MRKFKDSVAAVSTDQIYILQQQPTIQVQNTHSFSLADNYLYISPFIWNNIVVHISSNNQFIYSFIPPLINSLFNQCIHTYISLFTCIKKR